MALGDRQGEATAIFFDEFPTYRYVATLPYWLGRAQAGLGMTDAATENFNLFLSQRAADDPLANDARQRLE